MDEVPDDMFAAMGSNANCIFVIPSLNLVVARQGMDPDEDEAFFNMKCAENFWKPLRFH